MAEALSSGILGSASVASAGTLEGGRPADPRAVAVMAQRGLDISAHKSRNFSETLTPRPDLVIGLAGEHVRVVVDALPELFERSFTLKEFVRRGEEAGARRVDEDFDDYLRRVGEGRELWHLAGIRREDDVADPIGGTLETYESCANEIEELIGRMAKLIGNH